MGWWSTRPPRTWAGCRAWRRGRWRRRRRRRARTCRWSGPAAAGTPPRSAPPSRRESVVEKKKFNISPLIVHIWGRHSIYGSWWFNKSSTFRVIGLNYCIKKRCQHQLICIDRGLKMHMVLAGLWSEILISIFYAIKFFTTFHPHLSFFRRPNPFLSFWMISVWSCQAVVSPLFRQRNGYLNQFLAPVQV